MFRGEQALPSQVGPRDTVVQRIQQALANVPIQGVLLDGVDYGGLPEACYDPNCVALFRSDTGRNPRESLKGEWEQEWLRWRRERIDTLVRRVARAVRAQHPTVPLHLAVTAASADPRNNSLADWRTWIREGWIDGLCPHSGTGIAPTARKSAERVLRLAPGTRVMPIVDTARVRTARHAMTGDRARGRRRRHPLRSRPTDCRCLVRRAGPGQLPADGPPMVKAGPDIRPTGDRL